MNDKSKSKIILLAEIFGILSILILAGYLRFTNLRNQPDWYQDEGEFIKIAQGILSGQDDYMGLKGSMLFIGRPPTFFLILAGLFKIFGVDMLVLRGLTVTLSLFTILLAYFLARRVLGAPTAIYAALFLTILPEEILNNRLGFTYNWLALLFVLVVFATWNYLEHHSPRWLALAAMAAGLALASELLGTIVILFVLVVVLSTRPRDFFKAVLWVFLPLLMVLLPLIILHPGEVWTDLRLPFESGGNSSFVNLIMLPIFWVIRYGEMIRKYVWIAIALLGIFFLPDRRLKVLFIGLFSLYFVFFAPIRPFFGQYLLPIWPFVAIIIGSLFAQGVPSVIKAVKKWIVEWFTSPQGLQNRFSSRVYLPLSSFCSVLLVFAIFITPFIWLISIDKLSFFSESEVENNFIYDFAPMGFTPVKDITEVLNYLSPRLEPDNLVVASAHIGWALPARLISFGVFVNYSEGGKVPLVQNVDPQRYVDDLSLENIKYAVVDPLWYLERPGAGEALQEIQQWPLVATSGNLEVYCNPSHCQ